MTETANRWLFVSLVTLLGANALQAQPTATPVTAAEHIEAARALAGEDLRAPFEFFCVPGNARPNNFSAPALEPTRLFDNLYALGNSESVVYALTSSEGIVLLDAGHPGDMENLILPGLESLGLDPNDIKYVLIGHGHSDHYGGAALLQDQGVRIGSTAADWETIAAEGPSRLFGEVRKPERDLVLREDEALVVGDTTIQFVEIPGHTPGSLAFIFPVRDGGTAHVAGLFGGTVLASSFVPLDGLKQYVSSIAHFVDVAEQLKVDVELQNHPIFDDTPARLTALANRSAASPPPFVIGEAGYQRFWKVISSCMQAAIAEREDQ